MMVHEQCKKKRITLFASHSVYVRRLQLFLLLFYFFNSIFTLLSLSLSISRSLSISFTYSLSWSYMHTISHSCTRLFHALCSTLWYYHLMPFYTFIQMAKIKYGFKMFVHRHRHCHHCCHHISNVSLLKPYWLIHIPVLVFCCVFVRSSENQSLKSYSNENKKYKVAAFHILHFSHSVSLFHLFALRTFIPILLFSALSVNTEHTFYFKWYFFPSCINCMQYYASIVCKHRNVCPTLYVWGKE